MTKGCKNYTEIMRMSKCDISRVQDVRSISLLDFVNRFCHHLGISEKSTDIIVQIAEMCEDLKMISDNTPPSMASGCIYLYVRFKNLDISKKDISDVCKTSEVTVNKCYKKLEANEFIGEFLKHLTITDA